MVGSHIYTVVGFCSGEIRGIFEKIKQEEGVPYSHPTLWNGHIVLKDCPHFAVKRTFSLKDGTFEKELIESVLSINNKSVQIMFDYPDVFPDTPFGPTLFLPIRKTPELLAVHKQLVEILNPLVDTKNPEHELDGYRPHVAFQYNMPLGKIGIISKKLDNAFKNTLFVRSELSLLKNCDGVPDERVELSRVKLTTD